MAMVSRKAEILRYGSLGLITFVLYLSIPWLTVAGAPPWLRSLSHVINAVPWLVGAGLLIVAVRRKRWVPLVAFAGPFFLTTVAIAGLLFVAPVVADYASRMPFDSAKWKAENVDGAQGIRVRMVDDLLRHHRLVGMRRVQVDKLLGVPPPTPYFSEYDYVYWLGPERGPFGIDSEWLVLRCQQDIVVAAEVVTD